MSSYDFASQSTQSGGNDYRTFRQVTRNRLLHEMLGSTGRDSKSAWKVLIMDKFTVKIMSQACKMAEITEQGVSLVEEIYKRRQPLPSMDAVYFIQPSLDNVVMFVSDMSGRCALYRKAYLFFTSPVSEQCLNHIKTDASVMSRICALSEMNLEYFAMDSQGFLTDHAMALEELFAESAERSENYNSYLDSMAARIATVFASLREFPYVRYRAANSSGDESTVITLHDLVPTKLAAAVWKYLCKYKSSLQTFPQKETCELLIVDRSIDQIAPVIHEWTYGAMCYDLLNMEGNKYTYEVSEEYGVPTVRKEALLEEHDPLWIELRHLHIADASERLHERMTDFASKIKIPGRDGGEISLKDMKKVVRTLPQYREEIEKLSLHVEIAGTINRIIKDLELRTVGQLEQDLVFGDAGTKELINFLRANQDISGENMLRLLMIYAALYPDKIEGESGLKLMQLARLSPENMNAVKNMRCLAASNRKKTTGGTLKLMFTSKKNHAARREREGEETWALSRFYPMIEELIEKLNDGELSEDEYPFINDPGSLPIGKSLGLSVRKNTSHNPQSRRVRRGGNAIHSSGSLSSHSSADFKNMGQRIFIFIIGGATRSELRVVHKLTSKLRREVILGSSSTCDPIQFVTKMKVLNATLNDEVTTLDNLQI